MLSFYNLPDRLPVPLLLFLTDCFFKCSVLYADYILGENGNESIEMNTYCATGDCGDSECDCKG